MTTKPLFTESAMIEILKARVDKAGTVKAAAAELKFAPTFVSDVLYGRHRISPRLARALGFEVMPTMYRRK